MTVCHMELAGCLIKNITGRKMPRVGGQNSWELGGVEMEFLRII